MSPPSTPRPDEAALLQDMAERARRMAWFVGRTADRDALLDLARACEEALVRLRAAPPLHHAA
jgi:hypothetical protein